MKKTFVLSLFSTLILFLPLSVRAENSYHAITTSHSPDGSYYEILEEMTILAQRDDKSLIFSKTLTYSGKTVPLKQIFCRESIDGVYYSGTLYLSRKDYNPHTNQTIAVYVGTISP